MVADKRNYTRKQKKQIRRKQRIGIIIRLLILIISVWIVILAGTVLGKGYKMLDKEFQGAYNKTFGQVEHNLNPIDLDNVYSDYAILMSLEDQEILLNQQSNEKMYPASLTKIMTAILAIEQLGNLDETIELSDEIFQKLYEEQASLAGFAPYEQVTARDLIYGVLLPSGAESCMGLAEAIAGSEEAYVQMMNKKAKELKMENTYFTNVTGLHGNRHYSTVQDIAILLEYALKNDTFREIFTTKWHNTESTNIHLGGISFESTMFKKIEDERLNDGAILGGKTGYTDEAGLCLASLAQVGGEEYILVTAHAEGGPYTEPFNILDAFTIYNQMIY